MSCVYSRDGKCEAIDATGAMENGWCGVEGREETCNKFQKSTFIMEYETEWASDENPRATRIQKNRRKAIKKGEVW